CGSKLADRRCLKHFGGRLNACPAETFHVNPANVGRKRSYGAPFQYPFLPPIGAKPHLRNPGPAWLTALTAQSENCCSRFLDRAATDVNHGPIVARADLAGIGEFFGYHRTIRIVSGVERHGAAEHPVLPHMRYALNGCDQPDYQWPCRLDQALRHRHAEHDGNVGGLDATI